MKWEKVAIKDICTGIYDGPHATPPLSDTGAIFLGISNFNNGRLDFSDIRYISEDDLPKWTKRVIPQKNDIVFSYEATLNLYAIIPEGFRGCLGRRMALLRVDETKADYKFLYYYFYSDAWRATVNENIVLGATVDRIPLIKFPDFPVELPPLETQHCIADILSAYDDLIENNQKQIKLLEEAAQRLYKEWFVDLRFPGHENTKIVDGVPEGWNECTVESFGTVITGKTPPTSNKEYYTNGKVPFVTIPDMHNVVYPLKTEKRLTIEGAQTQKNKYIPPNSVMISCIGTVGLVSIATEVCQTNQQINSIILNNEDDLYFFYESMLRMKDLLDGLGSNGATMTNVNKSKLEKLIIISPSKDIVKQYNDVCKPLFESALNLSRKNVYLQNMREALLPKLMSGEVEI